MASPQPQPPHQAQKLVMAAWARGVGLTEDGPLGALVAVPRWCCWVWHPVYRKRAGEWVWTKRPVGAPKDGRQPWPLSVNRVKEQGRPYALARAAVEAGKADGVGWLMQEEWGWVWLDLDKCRDPVSGKIDAWAQAIIDRAPGCYAELTPSGTGVRLCGRADGLDGAMQGVWRPPGGEAEGVRLGAQVEIFYAVARFVTVTGRVLDGHEGGSPGARLEGLAHELRQLGLEQEPARPDSKGGSVTRGDVAADKTAPLEDVVSALEVIPNGGGWDFGEHWNDWTVVGMAAWNATEGSEEGLEAWKSWSAKCEDKHDPAACDERWKHWRRSPASDLGFGKLALLAGAASGGRWRRASRRPEAEFEKEEEEDEETRHPFLRLLDRVILVLHPRRYYDEVTGLLLDDDQLKVVASELGVGGFAAGGQKSVSARLQRHGLLRRADRLTMRPGQGRMVEEGGRPALNLWRPSALVPSEADASPWLRHMEALVPDEAERGVLLDRMAFLLQHPGVKINSGLLLLGEQEDGKDTGLEPLMKAIGSHNVAVERGSTMDSQFNSYMKRQLLLISEVPPWHRKSFYEDMKQWMTAPPDEVRINDKLVPHYWIPNIINVIATTNHDDALALPPNDRRWFVVRTAAVGGAIGSEEKAAYYTTLYRWFGAGGLEAAAGWLLRRDVTGFNPMARPAMSEAKHEMIKQGSSPAVTWACGLWEEDGGGALERRQLLTVNDVLACAAHFGHGAGESEKRSLNPKAIAMALTITGWRRIDTRVPDGQRRRYVWMRSGAHELMSELSVKDLLARLADDRRKNTGISDDNAQDEGWNMRE